jgi:hypothetical protein
MEFSYCGSIFARRVGSDNSPWYDLQLFADVAQLVEHHLAKVRVASSNLVVRSRFMRVVFFRRAARMSLFRALRGPS